MGAHWLDRGERPGRRREPADAHFRYLETEPRSAVANAQADALGAMPSRFEVYRADEVRTTSVRFVGGDWHWRLCDGAGQILVDAGGYRNETDCRAAVAILRERAGRAILAANA